LLPTVQLMPSSSRSDRQTFWRNLIARRESRQLTVREVCEEADVSPVSYFYWRRKFLAEAQQPSANPAPPLVPVQIVEDRIAELMIELPQGMRVRIPPGCDEATLQRVLRAALSACREQASC
jgi:transposase-like protein